MRYQTSAVVGLLGSLFVYACSPAKDTSDPEHIIVDGGSDDGGGCLQPVKDYCADASSPGCAGSQSVCLDIQCANTGYSTSCNGITTISCHGIDTSTSYYFGSDGGLLGIEHSTPVRKTCTVGAIPAPAEDVACPAIAAQILCGGSDGGSDGGAKTCAQTISDYCSDSSRPGCTGKQTLCADATCAANGTVQTCGGVTSVHCLGVDTSSTFYFNGDALVAVHGAGALTGDTCAAGDPLVGPLSCASPGTVLGCLD